MAKNRFEVDASADISLEHIRNRRATPESVQPIKAVVIGGGTGAPVSIRTLLSMEIETSAVVAMADDGGSTGILREEANVSPPGDIRKCLVAFAKNPKNPLTKAFRYRFEFAEKHVLGNMLLAALEATTGSFPEAIAVCEALLDTQGHVYPSTLDRITLEAKTRDGKILKGQANASKSKTALQKVWLEDPENCTPFDKAMEAIKEANLIVLGPGSLFTSIIPNLLVPGIVDAIQQSSAKTLFVCSLADMQGETWGLSAKEHVEALLSYGLDGFLDYVLIHCSEPLKPDDALTESYNAALGAISDASSVSSVQDGALKANIRPVHITYADMKDIQNLGPVVLLRDLKSVSQPTWHDPEALRLAFEGVLKLCHLPQK
ncbi:MAG: gluconeogenesis factor YvcK family protein [Raoultibacter sp.]